MPIFLSLAIAWCMRIRLTCPPANHPLARRTKPLAVAQLAHLTTPLTDRAQATKHRYTTAHGPEREAAVWRGSVRAAAAGPTPDQAWALLRDFCSLDRWVPSVQTCRRLEGADGRPGCVRYCAGPVNRAAPGGAVGWSKERLVEFDPAGRSYSYEVVETNKGFGRYRATVTVEPDPAGCAVRWSFEADPVQGWTLDGFVGFLEKLARGVAKRLEEQTMVGVDRSPASRVF